MITNAPLSVLIITLVLLFLTWKINNWYFRKQLNDKDATISLLEKRIQYSSEAIYKADKEREDEPDEPGEVLNAYIVLGDQLFIEGVNDVTNDTYDNWKETTLGWTARVSAFLRDQIPERGVALFTDTSGLMPRIYNHQLSVEHNMTLTIMDKLRGNLRVVLRDLR